MRIPTLFLCSLLSILLNGQLFAEYEEVVVSAKKIESVTYWVDNFSVFSLSSEDIKKLDPQHPKQIFTRIPGIWISRGSGQEHLTAIRSPVLTGPGACG